MRKVVFASIIACVCCGLFTGCELKRTEEKPKEQPVQEVTIVTNEEGEVVAAASSVTPEEAPATPIEEEAPADEAK